MRNILLMMATTLLPMCAMAQQEHSLTVNVEAPGTLASYIAEDTRLDITALTVKGSINGTDLGLIRTMAGNGTDGYATEGKLESLDLSGARLVRGGDVCRRLTTSFAPTRSGSARAWSVSSYPRASPASATTPSRYAPTSRASTFPRQ